MHRKGIFWLIVALLPLFIITCQKSPLPDCFMSTGKITRSERSVGNFQSVVLSDNINLVLKQSNENKIVVEAGQNLHNKIITEVQNDSVLMISNENSCNWVRSFDIPVTVYLDFKLIDILEYRSIGDVTNIDTLRMDSLRVDVKEGAGTIRLAVNTYLLYSNLHYGTADIEMSGNTTLSVVYMASFGRVDNRLLNASQCYVNNRSSNDMYLKATDRIGATIENIGNIYYLGNPSQIDLQRSGTGELIKIAD